MNKVKFKVNIKIISLLVLLLAFLMLPFGQFESTTAEGEYQISTEAGLKDWLNNTNSVQTNNPNAVLTQDITLNWGGVATYPATIEDGSSLDGQNFTIYLQGGTSTTPGGTLYGQLGLFADFINGTLKNTTFELLSDYNITIHADTAQKNKLLYTGVICGKMESGTIDNCTLIIDKSINFSTNTKGGTNGTDASSNHFGAVVGGMWGNSVVSNTKVIQTSNSTITVTAGQGFSFLRVALICSDPYSDSTGTPTIKNVYVERNGYVVFGNRSLIAGGEIYGTVVADLDTGDNGANHNVIIDGVIYNSTLTNEVYGGVTYNNRNQRSDNIHGYIIGARKESGSNFTISNIYSLIELTSTDYVTSATIGYTQLPSGYSYGFNGDNLVVTNGDSQGKFIWSISNNTGDDYNELYKQLSNAVEIPKKTVDTTTLRDILNITLGQIIDSAIVGFESAQVVYSGVAFQNVRIRIGDEIISSGFGVDYSNNLNSSVTSGTNATFALQYPDREDGIFLTTQKYFVEKSGISYDNEEMTINPAPLTITYTAGDVYTNNLSISGLVNGQQVTIDSAKYGNGVASFDCLNNSTTKTISFTDGVIETNYAITQNGLEDLTFEVSPKTISISEGITVTNADGNNAVFSENVLTIYSKDYQTIELEYSQPVGYLNRVDLTSSEGHSFKISSSLNDNVMSNTISSDTANELHYLDSIVLNESLQKVAVKIEIDTSLISNLTINGQRPVKYGDYLLIDADFGEELEFVITLLDDYQDYTISYSITSEPSQVEGNSFKINAISQTNNIMLITISITAPSV